MGVLRSGLAVGRDGRIAAGHRTGVRRDRGRAGTAHRQRVWIFGDRGDVGTRGGDRHRPGATERLRDADRAGRDDEGPRSASGCRDRSLDGGGRRGRRSGCALGRGRREGDLPPFAAHGPGRGLRCHGVSGTSCRTGTFRTRGPGDRRRRAGRGRLARVHRGGRSHGLDPQARGRVGETRRDGPRGRGGRRFPHAPGRAGPGRLDRPARRPGSDGADGSVLLGHALRSA